MFFYLTITMVIIIIPSILIGFYYFVKQKYNNPFVTLILKNDKLQLLKSKRIKKEIHKKLTLILSIQTLILVVLLVIFIYIFKSYNITLRYCILYIIFRPNYN